jgi:hypothetical protein
MSVEEIRLKAFTIQTTVRRNLIVTMLFGTALLVMATAAIVKLQSTPPRVIIAAVMLLILLLVYRAAKTFRSPGTLAGDAGLSDCVSFYRRELTAQYVAARGTWSNAVLETLLFLSVVWVSIHATVRYEAARIILPVLFAVAILTRYWKARNLKRQLRELDTFEKENK